MTHPYLSRYDRMADQAAAQVIKQYSSSFSLATQVLDPETRRDIRNVYAVVRIADEIVDGTTAEANECPETALDVYEELVLHAPQHRFHTDPVLHAWANTHRRCKLNDDHVRAFFASMRRDTQDGAGYSSFSAEDLGFYIYGSAEVIGLMCLDIFLHGHDPSPTDRRTMEEGARALGSAFQKVNFLRDFAEDHHNLGRGYLGSTLDEALKNSVTGEIAAELDLARQAVPLLPTPARRGVAAAEALFRELNERIATMPAADVAATRVSVPTHRKLLLTARAVRKAARKASSE
ncbi:Phytoene/squalene synthetase [Corynebacterium appendicis CIP 107643]|uniref:Phytoene/squalene synthetase n=1 Tax=Corynebacterium appendicis CIP 107643 TaxID=1161099 RepID=A0A1N7J5R8_9CORY|nr:phytoene/squalene synthase family protein [Corynebacterium appendicis]WJY61795.1 All-trans-phytoene synthase [Corynebacterium appendicis CIP 107643]SIS44654.1 Phytoene/squalene synthetase [Corynebacterium appendicis CIP 107643]